MAWAFCQIPLDPRDWSLMGIYWDNGIYLDKATVMGCWTAPYICQCVTNVIQHIMANLHYFTHNYVDDFIGIDAGSGMAGL